MEQPVNFKTSKKKSVLSPTMRLQLRQMQRKNSAARSGSLDWEAIRARMENAGQLTNLKADPARILRERATELARPIESATAGAADTLVILRRANCQMALEVEYVREIIPLENVTYVPGVPDFIVGVVNARGKILTLVNLEIFLRQDRSEARSEVGNQKQTIVMLEMDRFEFGALCDDFPIIGQHNPTQFSELNNINLDYRTDYLKGIGPEGVLLINLPALVADPDFLVEQE